MRSLVAFLAPLDRLLLTVTTSLRTDRSGLRINQSRFSHGKKIFFTTLWKYKHKYLYIYSQPCGYIPHKYLPSYCMRALLI